MLDGPTPALFGIIHFGLAIKSLFSLVLDVEQWLNHAHTPQLTGNRSVADELDRHRLAYPLPFKKITTAKNNATLTAAKVYIIDFYSILRCRSLPEPEP